MNEINQISKGKKKEYLRQYYLAHREELNAKHKDYYQEHKERLKTYQKEYYRNSKMKLIQG